MDLYYKTGLHLSYDQVVISSGLISNYFEALKKHASLAQYNFVFSWKWQKFTIPILIIQIPIISFLLAFLILM